MVIRELHILSSSRLKSVELMTLRQVDVFEAAPFEKQTSQLGYFKLGKNQAVRSSGFAFSVTMQITFPPAENSVFGGIFPLGERLSGGRENSAPYGGCFNSFFAVMPPVSPFYSREADRRETTPRRARHRDHSGTAGSFRRRVLREPGNGSSIPGTPWRQA